jgi:hypothetical protein
MFTESSPGRSRVPVALSATLVFCGLAFAVGRADAAEYYIAPTGSDSAAGTMAAPWATIQKGADTAAAGDTVWVRAGTYQSTKQIKFSKSGQSDTNRIKFWAYQGENPLIDLSKYASTNKAADVPAMLVSGSWLHFRGLEIANVPVGASGDHSISALRSNGGSNNTYELLNIHNSFGPGLFIDTGMGGNLILNCDSHDNYDKDGSQGDGQNGDGFGVHYQATGPSTIIRGCRAWLNSDDGYDLISQEVPVIVEKSWAFQNGYANGGSVSPSSGNGNGFKMGSSQKGVRHIVQNNVAWKNKAAGFYANHSSGGNNWYNNTSYMNGSQYNMLASPAGDTSMTITLTGALAHKMRNNIGFPNKNTNMGGVDTMFNTWDLSIAEASSDFVSTSDTGTKDPRTADGSMPAMDFLKLKAGSPLIDKGTNVSLPFVGTAPDLGAYEYGAVTTGTGGATGTGTGGATAGTGGAGAGGRGAGGVGVGGAGGRGTGGGAVGGAIASGGSTGTGGRSASGGTTGNGGSGSGGAVLGTGGSVLTGTGGAVASSGGATGTGGAASGSGGAAVGTGGSGAPVTGDGAGGCACSFAAQGAPGNAGGWIAILSCAFGLAFTRTRRRKQPPRA